MATHVNRLRYAGERVRYPRASGKHYHVVAYCDEYHGEFFQSSHDAFATVTEAYKSAKNILARSRCDGPVEILNCVKAKPGRFSRNKCKVIKKL